MKTSRLQILHSSLQLCERVDQIFLFQLYLHTWMADKTQIPDRVRSFVTSDGSLKLHKGTVHPSLLEFNFLKPGGEETIS